MTHLFAVETCAKGGSQLTGLAVESIVAIRTGLSLSSGKYSAMKALVEAAKDRDGVTVEMNNHALLSTLLTMKVMARSLYYASPERTFLQETSEGRPIMINPLFIDRIEAHDDRQSNVYVNGGDSSLVVDLGPRELLNQLFYVGAAIEKNARNAFPAATGHSLEA